MNIGKKKCAKHFFFNFILFVRIKKKIVHVSDDFKEKKLIKKCNNFFEKSGTVFCWNAVECEFLFRLESSIQKHAGSRDADRMGGAGGWSSPPLKKKWKKKYWQKKNSKYFLTFWQKKKIYNHLKLLPLLFYFWRNFF